MTNPSFQRIEGILYVEGDITDPIAADCRALDSRHRRNIPTACLQAQLQARLRNIPDAMCDTRKRDKSELQRCSDHQIAR